MADFSLKAVFGIDATGVKTELKKLRSDINDVAEDWAKIGLAAATTAFVALSKGALDLAEKLKDTALAVGINVEALQTLYYLAEQNGSSQEQMSKALEKARIGFQKAAEGSKTQSEALQTLGINIEGVINLPLERKFQSLALAYVQAEDKGAAFNAISEILGEKIGPKLMATLTELGERGFPDVAESAAAAGHVMSAETIEALESAKQSIENFKKEATVAVGNILVNFRSEEGLKLLGLQLMKVLASFGGGIVDAIVEGGAMAKAIFSGEFEWVVQRLRNGLLDAVATVAGVLNKVLPSKFEFNIGNIEDLKVESERLGAIISRNIAQTSPSTFKKDFTAMWDDAITEQKKVVDEMNRVDFKQGADNLRNAGEDFTKKVETRAAPAIADSTKKVASKIENAANAIDGAGEGMDKVATAINTAVVAMRKIEKVAFSVTGRSDEALSNKELEGKILTLSRSISARERELRDAPRFGPGVASGEPYDPFLGMEKQQLEGARKELTTRSQFGNLLATFGESGVSRMFASDPQEFERLMKFFSGQSDVKRTADLMTEINQRLANSGLFPKT